MTGRERNSKRGSDGEKITDIHISSLGSELFHDYGYGLD
jgi:hypothetical protein